MNNNFTEEIGRQINMEFPFFEDYFSHKFPSPQYLGAKYKHLSWIGKYIPKEIHTVLDAFSGSQSVAYYFKQRGFRVFTNDFLNCNNQIGKALIENNGVVLSAQDVKTLFSSNANPDYYDLMKKLYSGLFFTDSECDILDAFRSNLNKLDYAKQALALTIMNRSMTRKVTMGHFAHTRALVYASHPDRIKRNRSLIRPVKNIFLEFLSDYNQAVFDNRQKNKSFNEDAIQLISRLHESVDLLYLDPPYCGSHPDYQSFYHLLETYTEYWKDKNFKNLINRYSPKKYCGFDSKKDIINSFELLFEASQKIPYWLISYNDRSYPDQSVMVNLLKKYKKVEISCKEYYNNVGGKGSVKGCKELLFICSPKK